MFNMLVINFLNKKIEKNILVMFRKLLSMFVMFNEKRYRI